MALRSLNVLSICTGGAGLDLGLELAIPSARAVCMVEREAFAVARLVEAMRQGLLAPAPVWGDARTFNGRRWRGLVDGLIGGIPCQPHSLAGKRLADEDERDLWSIARRILVQSGAWFVVIENVGGMLSSGGAERVYRDLQCLGFKIEGGLFRASEVGASHERERLFILAVHDGRLADRARLARRLHAGQRQSRTGAAGVGRAGEGMADASFGRRHVGTGAHAFGPGSGGFENGRLGLADAGGARRKGRTRSTVRVQRSPTERGGEDMGHAVGRGRDGRPNEPERRPQGRTSVEQSGEVGLFPPGPADRDAWTHVLARAPHLEPAVRGVADGVASRVDELRLLGNGVVPLQAAYAARTLATDLARRSAGAALLVRMMEAA